MSGGHVFISYAHADIDYVRSLVSFLRGDGVEVWFDDQIPTGQRWDQVLEHQIDTCAAVVVVMSPAARDSHWVGVELDHARGQGRPIFPLLLDGTPIFGMGVLQYESVAGRRLPSTSFVAQLRDPAAAPAGPSVSALAHRVRQVGVVPNAADCFQHRAVSQRLDQALTERRSAIVTQILSGLGGVGKTQLAASATRQLVARCAIDDVVWVTAASTDAIMSTLGQAGAELAGAGGDDPPAAAQRLLAWLATTDRRWLVVFDDVADPRLLDGWWPPRSPNGRVLVTTRRRDAGLLSHGQLVDVESYTAVEAEAYLRDKFAGEPYRLVEANEMADDLGCLPVALAQAAAYIADRNLTCAQFRARLVDHPLAKLAPDAWPDDYPRSVAVTLSLAVEAADQLEPRGLARPLLALLSLLDPNGIPQQLVTTQPVVTYVAEQCGTTVVPDQAHDALSCLSRLNLVTVTRDEDLVGVTDAPADFESSGRPRQLVRVHAMVQRAVRDRLGGGNLAKAARAAADALAEIWPTVEHNVSFAQALRANTATLRATAEDHLWEPDQHVLLSRAGLSLAEAGLVVAAIGHFQTLAMRALQVLGPDHRHTLAARRSQAFWGGAAGDTVAAVGALERLLVDCVRSLGPEHADTLTTRASLAHFRGRSGDANGALVEFEALLRDRERVLGSEAVDTLIVRGNVARWRGEAGDPNGAVRAFESVLEERERILGPDHPRTLAARHGLARWRGEAGDAVGAADAFEQLLADRVRVLGPDHPHTLTARSNLARWRAEAGDTLGAIAALEVLLSDRLRVLGPGHPDTLTTRDRLANLQGQGGDVAGSAVAPLPDAEL